ncbi:MAG TPA: flagellar motor protein MotB [Anaeromyxobacteraceae bacterium]|nr:flagellar motor protein MotB [Anaeromyxobacteraceae bacterium]
MAGHRKKKHHEEEHENHERWLVSYADFITLLFAFVVVMYSVSRVDNKKLTQAVQGIRWALHTAGNGGTGALPLFEGPPSEGGCRVAPGASSSSLAERAKAVEDLRRRIEKKVLPFVMNKAGPTAVTVHVEDGHRLVVRLAAANFFDPGQAALRPQVLPILDAVSTELKDLDRPLRIEGHTDDSPVQGGRFHGNWDLSAARAATVTAYLQDAHRVPPGHLSAVGLADTKPVSREPTETARELNRRVEMVVELNTDDPLLNPGGARHP